MSDSKAFLEDSSSYPAFKFETPGDSIAGVITGTPRIATVSKLGTTTGETVDKLVVNLIPNPAEPENVVSVWVNRGAQARAIGEAVKAAGAEELLEGGKLMVTFTGLGQAKQAGYSPPKLYTARYMAPPAPAAQAQAGFFGDPAPAQNAPAQPQATPAAQPAPAAAAAPAQAVGSWED